MWVVLYIGILKNICSYNWLKQYLNKSYKPILQEQISIVENSPKIMNDEKFIKF